MTIEEKNILIEELCMRIPYGVKCNINGKLCKVTRIDVECQQVYLKKDDGHGGTYSIARGDVIKPCLRPMSSMTEAERKELAEKGIYIDDDFDICYDAYEDRNISLKYVVFEYVDWLNAHHFDYRGLIEKGLALEAPEGMYAFD